MDACVTAGRKVCATRRRITLPMLLRFNRLYVNRAGRLKSSYMEDLIFCYATRGKCRRARS